MKRYNRVVSYLTSSEDVFDSWELDLGLYTKT